MRILDRCTVSKQQWHRNVAGTTWHFVGAMLSGEELDAETATGVLDQNYGGTLDMVFDEDGNATMEQGGGNLTGTYE